jgi:methyltransferase (TIGR00027 family)
MIEHQPSRTAQRVAHRRAVHQIWDDPKVLEDPVAIKILGHDVAAEITGARPSDSPFSVTLRAFLVARSRFAEDQLALAVEQGVRQYVVLGAGLDTFAYRNPFAGVHVFEVDHPATQAWKQQKVQDGGVSLPPSLTFVPVDFEKDTLDASLGRAGFKSEEPAFFSWLGVTPYLARQTVFATLRWIISACAANAVVFDYPVPREHLSPAAQISFQVLASRVAEAGEPFISFYAPDDMSAELRAMGYLHVEDLGTAEINERYFRGRTDDLRVGGAGRLVCARGQLLDRLATIPRTARNPDRFGTS